MRIESRLKSLVAVLGLLLLFGCGDFFVSGSSLVSIAVTPANPTIQTSKTQQFTATGTYGDQSTKDLTAQVAWTSSSTGVATITSAGLATATANGSTTISAAFSGSGTSKVTGSTTLTVSNVVVNSISIQPSNSSIRIGQTQQFSATANNSDGTTKDVTNTVTWQSSSAGVASISGTGLATGLSAGSTTITATLGSTQATTSLNVTAF